MFSPLRIRATLLLSLTVGYTLISGDPVSTVPMECRHFRKEGVIIVEGVYFLSIRTRTTDVESGTIVRVMQFELVAIGDCGQRIIL